MRVIIIGCGRVGSHLANVLSAERHDVVIIDSNSQSFRRLSREFNGRMLTGVGFDRDILQKADVERADALAATTDSDNVNIVSTPYRRNTSTARRPPCASMSIVRPLPRGGGKRATGRRRTAGGSCGGGDGR